MHFYTWIFKQKAQEREKKRALGYKGHTTFAYNYLRRKLMSDICFGVFGGHIVKLIICR